VGAVVAMGGVSEDGGDGGGVFDHGDQAQSVRTIIPYLVGAAEYGETVWSGVEGLALAAGAESS